MTKPKRDRGRFKPIPPSPPPEVPMSPNVVEAELRDRARAQGL